MSDTKLQLKAKDPSGTATNLNVTNVNPNASDANMLTFTQSLNALTKNTYVQTNKIITTDLDNEGDNRQIPTLELKSNGQTIQPVLAFSSLPTAISGSIYQYIYTNSTGKPSISYVAEGLIAGISPSYIGLFIARKDNDNTFNQTAVGVIVHIDGDDNYIPADLEITITV